MAPQNLARPGDVVIQVACCQKGSVLVKETLLGGWFCGSCGGRGRQIGRLRYDENMELVGMSAKTQRSYG